MGPFAIRYILKLRSSQPVSQVHLKAECNKNTKSRSANKQCYSPECLKHTHRRQCVHTLRVHTPLSRFLTSPVTEQPATRILCTARDSTQICHRPQHCAPFPYSQHCAPFPSPHPPPTRLSLSSPPTKIISIHPFIYYFSLFRFL
jgi:hypothetical protein